MKGYCANCKRYLEVKLIRGFNGARDMKECQTCKRRWPA